MGKVNSGGPQQQSRLRQGFIRFKGQYVLQLMVIVAIIWYIIFCYVPMYGIIIAFKDYKVGQGFLAGDWVGLKHFYAFFSDKYAWEAIGNTLLISTLKLAVGFPAPIIFALLLNELRSLKFKKVIQTVSYLPFFISWVVVASIISVLFSVEGPVNTILYDLGWLSEKHVFLSETGFFRPMAVISDLWKGIGWSSIIYIAAISSVPQDMYESAIIDGASRFRRAWSITIPTIMPTIILLLIMSVSGILGSNFDQHFLLRNSQNVSVSETIDTYVYIIGLKNARYSYGTAVNLARSVIAFILLFSADRLSRFITKGEHGLF